MGEVHGQEGGAVMKPKRIFTENEKLLIMAMWEMGKTDEQIAGILQLKPRNFSDILKSNGLTAVIKKEHWNKANDKVEMSLYNKAMGGNIVAMIFWLCNRAPERWVNVQRLEHGGKGDTPIKIEFVNIPSIAGLKVAGSK
jgi:hypothetical protein